MKKKVMPIFLILIPIFLLSPVFNVRRINIENNFILESGYIISLLPPLGNIFTISGRDLRQTLLTEPHIQEVSFSRDFLRTVLNIYITERRPVGYVELDNYYLSVDIEGRILGIVTTPHPFLPILTSSEFDRFYPGEIIEFESPRAFYTVARLATLFYAYEINNDIIRIDVRNSENIRLHYVNIIIDLGTHQDLDEKIRILAGTLPYVERFRNLYGHLIITDTERWFFRLK